MLHALRLQKTVAALTTSVVGAAIVLATMTISATFANAQNASADRRSSFSVEANPFRGTISYAHTASTNWDLGAGVGFGFPQIDLTLFRGKRDDFRDYAHIGAFARRHYSKRALLELGLRLGAADYQPCLASDCWPKVYFGPSVLFAVGGEHVKIGSRLTLGEISSPSGDLDGFASVSPLNLLFTLRW